MFRRRAPAEGYRFNAPLVLEHDPDTRNRVVRQSFAFEGPGDRVSVPRGFVTDLASIPRAIWWLYPPDGQWAQAAVVHDLLYREQRRGRALADATFLEGMKVLGVPWHRRTIIYLSVRLFGWLAWRANARALKGSA